MSWHPSTVLISLPALATVLVGLVPAAPASAKTTCRFPGPAPDVVLELEKEKLKYHNGFSSAQLSRMHRRPRLPARANERWQHLGLTDAKWNYALNVRVRGQETSSGRVCGRLSSVDLRVGYKSITVYIAREHRPGSCQYAATLDHENLHVSILRDTMQAFMPRIRRRLERVTARMKPVLAANADLVAAVFFKKIEAELNPLIKEFHRQTDRANAKLDTPENYRREQARCEKRRN